jgi:hypothetical protein
MFVLLTAAWNDCSAGDPSFYFGFATLGSAVTAVPTGGAFLIGARLWRDRSPASRFVVGTLVATFVGYILLSLWLSTAPSG